MKHRQPQQQHRQAWRQLHQRLLRQPQYDSRRDWRQYDQQEYEQLAYDENLMQIVLDILEENDQLEQELDKIQARMSALEARLRAACVEKGYPTKQRFYSGRASDEETALLY